MHPPATMQGGELTPTRGGRMTRLVHSSMPLRGDRPRRLRSAPRRADGQKKAWALGSVRRAYLDSRQTPCSSKRGPQARRQSPKREDKAAGVGRVDQSACCARRVWARGVACRAAGLAPAARAWVWARGWPQTRDFSRVAHLQARMQKLDPGRRRRPPPRPPPPHAIQSTT
jgi:hypothetical protein